MLICLKPVPLQAPAGLSETASCHLTHGAAAEVFFFRQLHDQALRLHVAVLHIHEYNE